MLNSLLPIGVEVNITIVENSLRSNLNTEKAKKTKVFFLRTIRFYSITLESSGESFPMIRAKDPRII